MLVNSAGIRIKGVPRGDMFICSEDELLKLLFAGNGAAEWLQILAGHARSRRHLRSQPRRRPRNTPGRRGLCNPKLDRWLHRVDVPTHIIWGEEDRVIPPAYAEALNGLHRRLDRGDAARLRASAAYRAAADVRRSGVAIHPEGRAMKVFLFHLMPYAASGHELHGKVPRRLGGAAEQLLRSEEGPRALQPLSRRARTVRRARLRRHLASTSITRTPTA